MLLLACTTSIFPTSATSAAPADAGFLRNAQIGGLTRHDIDALNSTVGVVLNTKSDGQTIRWSNHGMGERVSIDATLTPESTSIRHVTTCRYVLVIVNAGGKPARLRPRYCRTGDAPWVLEALE